ncbi:peptide chain release factor 1-like, mitochondrial isoform X2 [Atheta coriaria]|uniref:peptide chain release factor 1-like, mitochondrial isoform X2 n=1 Tax=Dalotia coriaria TaxID=877792 RepID=UPI0031F42166
MKFINLLNKLYRKPNIGTINNFYVKSTRCFHTEELKIQDLSLTNYINQLQTEYKELSNANKTSPRLRQLQPIDNDNEIRKLAEEEQEQFKLQLEDLNNSLKELLLPVDEEDDFNSITLEVNAGVGGQEAMLFASEMFNMYQNFVMLKGWHYELAEYLETDTGGIRHGALLINGDGAYKYLRHEAGVHRVQRNPATERSGRIHTSTVSVLALPQPTDIQIHIETKDLKIETKRATGAGGQHVNTTDSAVRIVHLPTGVAVECQTDRSQRKNKEIALLRLKAKLYQAQLDEQLEKVQATKRSQVKSNFRNEKIRTYNFNQDRITDHRLEGYNVHNLKGFLSGGEQLENLIEKIDYNRRIMMLKELIQN